MSLLFNYWSESIHNSVDFVFSDCCSRSNQIWRQYHKCRSQILTAELNTVSCHDAWEVYDYPCFIIVVEESASGSCQLALEVSLSSDDVDPYFDFALVTACLLCWLPSSTLGACQVVEIVIPWLDKTPYVRFRLSLIKNCQPYPADLRCHATVGSLLLYPTKLWSFIIPSSLKPMANFVHLIHLFVVLPWSITWHTFVSLLLNDFTKSTTLLVTSSFACTWT
jgi:hypothetical protein